MENKYGDLTDLVKTAGFLFSAAIAISLTWRGRARWEPSEQDLPKAPQRMAGLISAVLLAILWYVASSTNAWLMIVLALVFTGLTIISVILYCIHIGVLTFDLPADPTAINTNATKIIGGYWLTVEAKRKSLFKTRPVSPAQQLTESRQPEQIWPRLSRTLAKIGFMIGYISLNTFGTLALASASTLLLMRNPGASAQPTDKQEQLSKEKTEKLLNRIKQVVLEANECESFADQIRVLKGHVLKLEEDMAPHPKPEVEMGVAGLITDLSNNYYQVANYKEARLANEKAYNLIVKHYKANPLAQFAVLISTQSAAYWLWDNRISHVFFERAELDRVVDDNTRQRNRDSLDLAMEAIKEATKDDTKREGGKSIFFARMWLRQAISCYAIGDLDNAGKALEEAIKSSGHPSPAENESDLRRDFFGFYYIIKANISAEKKDYKVADASLRIAADYGKGLRNFRELFGYSLLLTARVSPPEWKKSLLVSSRDHLKSDHCPACAYNIACVQCGLSQFENGTTKDKLLNDSASNLKRAIEDMSRFPLKIDLDAIQNDPMLKEVVVKKEVQDAIRSYKWQPEATGVLPLDELFSFGIPLKAVQFSRLNGKY